LGKNSSEFKRRDAAVRRAVEGGYAALGTSLEGAGVRNGPSHASRDGI
jgi:hypothetical protein